MIVGSRTSKRKFQIKLLQNYCFTLKRLCQILIVLFVFCELHYSSWIYRILASETESNGKLTIAILNALLNVTYTDLKTDFNGLKAVF